MGKYNSERTNEQLGTTKLDMKQFEMNGRNY